MPSKMPPLLEQLAAHPLLIDEGFVDVAQASIQHVLNCEHADAMLSAAVAGSTEEEDFWPQPDAWESRYRPYNVKDGTLQIPVMGVLLHRFPYQVGRWATGYKYLEMAVKRGLADGNVQRIAFVIDSPGGEVAGCFELTDFIYENRNVKPMRTFVADHSYSAAFAIGTAPGKGKISVTRSGGVGSVGVVTMHVDYSEAYKQMGVKLTYIFKGKHKVDGNSANPLPAEVKARIEKRIEKLYSVFTSTVARNRGMEEQAVRDTEALTYDAEDGIEIGFADRLGALDDEMALFNTDASTGDEDMATYTQEQYDAAVASARTEGHAQGKTEGKAEGKAEGAAEAQARLDKVLGSEEAKKRPKAAQRLLKTNMSADDVISCLADLDEEKAPAATTTTDTTTDKNKAKTGTSHFDAAMGKGPEVGTGEGEGDGEADENASANSILADYAGATGIQRKKTA